jgi:DNA-binding protein HU-beta
MLFALHIGAFACIDRLSRLPYGARRLAIQQSLRGGAKMAGKADVVDALAAGIEGMSKKTAGDVFDLVFDTIGKHLRKEDRVQVPGFGSFDVRKRSQRKGRNPATGATITIKASKNVRFKAGKELKDSLNKKK